MLFCLIASGFLLFAVGREMGWPEKSGPRAELMPMEVDLGDVPVGQAIERKFMLRNTGDERLLVTDVKSSCQCAVAELASRALMPGMSEQLVVMFRANDVGDKQRHLIIKTNDLHAPIVILTLVANVVPRSVTDSIAH